MMPRNNRMPRAERRVWTVDRREEARPLLNGPELDPNG